LFRIRERLLHSKEKLTSKNSMRSSEKLYEVLSTDASVEEEVDDEEGEEEDDVKEVEEG
jgi:hypothetical protein